MAADAYEQLARAFFEHAERELHLGWRELLGRCWVEELEQPLQMRGLHVTVSEVEVDAVWCESNVCGTRTVSGKLTRSLRKPACSAATPELVELTSSVLSAT